MNAEFETLLRQTVADRIAEIKRDWVVSPEVGQHVDAKLRHVVKMNLGLGCVCGCWAGKSARDEFLIQIPENIWLAIILSLRGHLNSANVAVRQAIELLLKHVYFLHHPVEYEWVQSDDSIKEFGFQMLLEYTKRIRDFDHFTAREDCLSALSSCYSEASRYVHVHSPKFIGNGAVAKTPKDCVEAFGSMHSTLERIIPAISVITVIYQYSHYLEMSGSEQRLAAASWTPKLKDAFGKWKRRRDLHA